MGQFIRFVMVGVLNTGLGYAIIFSCMYLVGLSPIISNVIGYMIGLILSYGLNRKVTFRSKSKSKSEVFRFLFVFFIAYLFNLGGLFFLLRLPELNEAVAQVVAGLAYVAVSFFLNKYYVFLEVSR